jgi:hypothetical protein
VITPEAVKSERCTWEVGRTLELSKRLLPVVHKPVPENEIPEKLRRLQFVRFDTGRALTRSIAELAEALRVDLHWIREHTRLAELATRWIARNQPESLLLRGDDLEAAKAWIEKRNEAAPAITEAQRTFVAASEDVESARLSKERAQLEEMARAQAATARQQRRAARLLWGIAALMLVMVGYVTWKDYDVAKRELNVFTARATEAMKDEQFDRAMRYAMPAYLARGGIPWLTPFSTELEGKLAGGAQLSRLHRLLKGHTGSVPSAGFSPDGKRVVTASDDGTAASGTPTAARRSRCSKAIPIWSGAPVSAPTASAWRRRLTTAPAASGTPTAARRSRCSKAIPAPCRAPVSAPTASAW